MNESQDGVRNGLSLVFSDTRIEMKRLWISFALPPDEVRG